MEFPIYIHKGKSMEGFKVKFDIYDYKDVWKPATPKRLEEIINWDKHPDDCVWKRVVPDVITERYKQQEMTRVLKTGVWIFIKNMPVWLPPSYYFFLQYFRIGTDYPQFRLKRLKHVYHKLRVRNNPRAIGTYTIKNRQDGETTIAMSDCLWEVAIGNMDFASIGIQSKTRDTVVNSCWRILTMGWNSMDNWIKNILYSDFASGTAIAEKMKFVTTATDDNIGRDVLITYGAGGHNVFDSMNNMRRCVLDEVNKWKEVSFYSTFLNYKKFIAPGTSRKGLFDIFSSPSDTSGKHNVEAYEFWKGSDPDKLTEVGSTSTRVFRYYLNPLEGIEGEYDKYGDADPDEIYKIIMRDRKSVPKDKLMEEIRGLPLNEEEMFGSTDDLSQWDNTKGIVERNIYLLGTRVKNTKTNEPINIYGIHEWRDGVVDSEVDFRMSDASEFNLENARVCYSYLPLSQEKDPLRYRNDIPVPPSAPANCLGIDPYDKRHVTGTRLSNGAMVNHKFLDFYETGIVKCPTMIYSNRPTHPEIFYEDAIKAAVFNRALVQVENKNSNIVDYFEDRGYIDWMLSKIGQPKNSLVKGDAPSGGKNAFLDEMISLLNAITNTPLKEGDKYHLEQNWFYKLLEDLLKFNRKDTHENDLSMAWGQALIGTMKILGRKVRKKHPEMAGILSYMLD